MSLLAAARSLPRSYWGLWIANFVEWAGWLVVPFFTLYLTREIGYSPATAGLIVSLFGGGGLIANMSVGPLIDRIGPRAVILMSLLSSAAIVASMAVVTNHVLLIVLVLVLGFTSQAGGPAASSFVAVIVPTEHRRTAYSFQYVGTNAGFSFGPAMGGFLVEYSFALVFVIDAVALLIAALILVIMTPRARWDPEAGAGGGQDVKASDTAAKSPAPAIETTDRAARRGLATVLTDGPFLIFVLFNTMFLAVYSQMMTTLPMAVTDTGLSTADYGLLLTLNGVMLVAIQVPLDRLTRNFRLSTILIFGSTALAIGFGLQSMAYTWWAFACCTVIWTFGELFNMPTSTTLASQLAPRRYIGRYMGTFSASFSIGSIVGASVGSLVFDKFGPQTLWLGCGAIAICVTVGRIVTLRQIRRRMGTLRG